jgi:hypothetical protein
MSDITRWSQSDIDKFWAMADALQDQTVKHADELFKFSETATPNDLKSMLIQYRFFTIYYIPDIAILIARLKPGKLRSLLADILSDELGFGDPLKAHPRLYDDFLKSLGIPIENLDNFALKKNIDLLENIREQLIDPRMSTAHGVGLRGMGGECVCQIYLAKFYEHLMKNPLIQKNINAIDWRFGEHDIEHRIKTRQMINDEIVNHGEAPVEELAQGYRESMNAWTEFWDNVYMSVKTQDMEITLVPELLDFQLINKPKNAITRKHFEGAY